MILQKPKSYWCYVKHGQSIADYQILRDITSRCKGAIKAAKSNYFSGLGESLNDPAITLKRYWSVLHRFLHKCKIPKISLIHHNNMFLTDTLVKANTFNSFSARQCSLIETGNRLPAEYLLSHHRLELVNLDAAKILSIICALDISKAHGWDNVSVCMVKICDESLVKSLLNIFQSLFETGNILINWKRGNIVLVLKKGIKDLINNYRPVSLLSFSCKPYKKSQSGFHKGDFMCITHEIFEGFDGNPSLDTCRFILDISQGLIGFRMGH